jgi:hypothetical protein
LYVSLYHLFPVFDERPRHISPRQHIALVCQHNHRDTVACCYEDQIKKSEPSKGISRIIGEWSASFDTLVSDKLDVVMAGIASNGTLDIFVWKIYLFSIVITSSSLQIMFHFIGIAAEFDRQISPKRQAFLRNFVEAQMVTYEAVDAGVSSGWFYWTFKME